MAEEEEEMPEYLKKLMMENALIESSSNLGFRERRAQDAWREIKNDYAIKYGPIQSRAIAGLIKRWVETGDTSFVDDAIRYCELENLPVSDNLRKHLAQAATKRLKSPSRAVREGIKEAAFKVMANLIFNNASLKEAAGKAAMWIAAQNAGYVLKASTLEKDYTKDFRGNPSIEEELFEEWRRNSGAKYSNEWDKLRATIPEPTDEERGERR